MSKFVKVLIIINGLIIPMFLGYIIIKEMIRSNKPKIEVEQPGYIVGERLEIAKKDSIGLQGITYDAPDHIYNSTNYYVSISTLTYEQAIDFKNAASSANNINYGFAQIANILFIDKDYNIIGTLLDKKASIADMDIQRSYGDEVDTTAKYIAYQIGFKDTNGDDLLNFQDAHELYISDHSGKNLVKVADNVDIEYYYFMKDNNQMMIHYKERDEQLEEYRKLRFGIYDISTGTLTPFTELHQKLDEMEMEYLR